MADERPPIGGDFRQVTAALNKLQGDIAALRADNVRIRSSLSSLEAQGRTRANVAEEARGAVRARATAEQPRARTPSGAQIVAQNQRAGGSTEESARLQQRLETLRAQTANAPGDQTARFANETARLSQVQASASLRQARLNALHTEYLTALGRGESSLSAFRAQMGATIAKFAGWTAASAAVFGALGAIRELGAGALDGLHAVNLLTRVMSNPDKGAAARGFQKLSQDLNVPLELAGQTTFRAAQSNKNLADAFAVSRAALIAYKVDNVDATEATLKLISIQQGLGISGKEVTGVFDQINQAQREFGVRVQYTLSGTAKASGAFRAAGGDYSHLLALLTTGVRVSGRTGDQLGTALQRSPGLISRPANQKLLRGFGIDPTQGINDIYEDAIKKAPQLAGRQQLQLARALSSPQLAPAIVGILQHGDLYKKILAGTSPERSHGSAENELQKALKSPREELDKFVNGLQRLGFSLAQLGAFSVFGVMLKALNGSVTAINSLLGVANQLPEPFRKAGVLLLEMLALMKLARRFNVGAGLPGGTGTPFGRALAQSPEEEARRAYLKGSRQTLDQAQERRQALTNNLYTKGRAQQDAEATRGRAQVEAQAARESGNAAGEATALETVRAEQIRINALRVEIAEQLKLEQSEARYINELNAGIASASRQKGKQFVRSTPGATVVAPGGSAPTTAAPRTVEEVARGSGLLLPAGVAAGAAVGAAEAQAAQAATAETVRASTGLNRGLLSLATVGNGLRAGAARLPSAAAGAGAALRGGYGALRNAALRITSLIGPFELFFIGLIAQQAVLDDMKDRVNKANAKASATPATVGEAHQAIAENYRIIHRQATSDFFTGAYEGLRDRALGIRDQATQADLDDAALKDTLRAQRVSGIGSGRTNYALTSDTIHNQFVVLRKRLNAGYITLKEYQDGIDQALKDLAGQQKGSKGQQQRRAVLAGQLREARGVSNTQSLYSLVTGDAQKDATTAGNFAAAAAATTATRSQRQQFQRRASYVEASIIANLSGPAATSDDIKAIYDAQDKIVSGAVDAAKADLDRALLSAKGQRQRNAAYDQFIGDAQRYATQGFDERIALSKRRVARDRAGVTNPAAGLKLTGNLDLDTKNLKEAERANKLRLGTDLAEYNRLNEARKQVARATRDAVKKEVEEAKFTENQDLQDALAQVAEARVQDEPVQAGAIALKRAHDHYMALLAHYGANDKRTVDALKGYIDAEHAQEQNVIAQIGEGFDIRIAATRDPVAKAQLGVQKVQTQLAHAHGSKRRQLLVEYYNALDALDQARLDIANSELDLAASKTDDPIQLAKIELQRAAVELKNAHGVAARNKALAAQNTARRSIANARVTATEEELDYEVEIGKITTQQEIDGLKKLLAIKNLGKQARLELKRKIGRLEHEGAQDLASYELTVGNIKLPTVYEIRRAALQGLGNAQAHQFVNNVRANVTIYVNDGAQARTVGQQLEDVLGTGRSDLRSLGTGGL